MSLTSYRPRPIHRILVANRGEIAIRILQACHELPEPPITYAIHTDKDSTHATLGRPSHSIQIPSAASYMDIDFLIDLVKRHKVDAIHPGYGFLSESPEFSRRMWEEADCMVVGPGWHTLERTGHKLKAKRLADECKVPILKAMSNPSNSVDDVRKFADSVGFPIMIKAVDGGGGRGIRLVRTADALQNAVERCIGESPSKTVFAEQAAINDFKHIEVQVIGDGQGNACHVWERDCSVQRRFQKIVEVAPTPAHDRKVIGQVIRAATRMAKHIQYLGLGTFEFLVNLHSQQYFFLEINPRLQVEHTISESIFGVDLVSEQLLIASGRADDVVRRFVTDDAAEAAPHKFSIQFRLCSENPDNNFSLSIGKVSNAQFPTGNGIRVDSHLSKGGVVGSDFDNLMAKIIVTASSWNEVLAKSQRALADTTIEGVKTNLNLLRAIVSDPVFQSGQADNEWLEKNLNQLVETGKGISRKLEQQTRSLPALPTSSSTQPSATTANATTSFRKGDAWALTLEKPSSNSTNTSVAAIAPQHHLRIDKIARNDFPESLVADISYTTPGHQPQSYRLTVNSTSASTDATSSRHRRGDPANKSHIVLPMGGKLVEVLVEEGDEVVPNQVVAFIKQMKMELEVRSPRAGVVKWVVELEDEEAGDDVAEGVLIAELETDHQQGGQADVKSKL